MGIFDYLYSKKAIAQLKAITPISGSVANQEYSCFIFKWPYQANVINILDTINSNTVYNPFISISVLISYSILSGNKSSCTFVILPHKLYRASGFIASS